MGKNSKVRKPKVGGDISRKQARAECMESIKTAMLICMTAMADKLDLDEDTAIAVMAETALYSEHMDIRGVRMTDTAEALYNKTGLDLRIRRVKNELQQRKKIIRLINRAFYEEIDYE